MIHFDSCESVTIIYGQTIIDVILFQLLDDLFGEVKIDCVTLNPTQK